MTAPVLEVSNLHVAFDLPAGPRTVVAGVGYSIPPGRTLGVVGESGCGKSMTALALMGLVPRPGHVTGSIRFQGQEITGQPAAAWRAMRGARMAMVFQEPMSALNPTMPVGRQIAEALVLHEGLAWPAAGDRAVDLLDQVGIPAARDRAKAYPHQLSGGQRQRAMIAMALACEPLLLIADEPTTALDVTVQRRILALLKDLQQRLGMALLLISHDLNVVRSIAQRVAVMRAGQIVEQADCQALFAAPQHAYSRQLLEAEPEGRALEREPAGNLLEVDDLRVWFAQGGLLRPKPPIKAVDGIDLRLQRGKTLGIVGESGSGKSTLGQAILRLIDAQGSIRFQGQALDALKGKALRPWRRKLQVVFQDPFGSLSPRMSVQQIIEEGLRVHTDLTAAQLEAEVISALRDVGLDPDTRHRFPHEFSGGQRQRIAIARALVIKPDLILLDEPTSALDRTVQKQVVSLLRRLQEEHGLTYLFISHDLAVVRALAHDLMVVKDGVVVEAGASHQVFDAPQHPYTQELLAAANIPL